MLFVTYHVPNFFLKRHSWLGCGKTAFPYIAVESDKWYNSYAGKSDIVHQNTNTIILWPTISTSVYLSYKNGFCMHSKWYMNEVTNRGSVIVNNWKQTMCILIENWLNNSGYIYTIEYHAFVKRMSIIFMHQNRVISNKILSFPN